NDSRRSEGDLKTDRFQGCAEPAVAGIKSGKGDPGDRGRQCKWKIDRGIHQAFSRKTVASQNPSEQRSREDVDHSGDKRGVERKPQSGDDTRLRKVLPKAAEPEPGRAQKGGRKRNENDQTEIADREPQGDSESGQAGAPRILWRIGRSCCLHKTRSGGLGKQEEGVRLRF